MSKNQPSRALERVREQVEHLIEPSLAPLYELFMERKKDISKQRMGLEGKLAEIREEGYEAAVRLMMPEVEKLEQMEVPYFEQVKQLRGPRK